MVKYSDNSGPFVYIHMQVYTYTYNIKVDIIHIERKRIICTGPVEMIIRENIREAR